MGVRARRLNYTTVKPTNSITMKPLLRLPRRSFSSTKFFKGPIDQAFRDVNYDFASTTPTERTYVRRPIIINGAGPAGLILAIGLKNARIPFEICEHHRHDLPDRPRRNHVSVLVSDIFEPLRKFLRVPNAKSFLDKIALNPPSSVRLKTRCFDDYPIYTEALLELLRQQVRVNYGFRLEYEGISCLESVVTSRYNFGDKIMTFEGSLLVGADGIFSTGRAHQSTQRPSLIVYLAVRRTYNLYAWPAITYASTIVVSPERYESEFKRLLDRDGATSLLIGNTRLALSTNSKSFLKKVHMTLWYSRMAASPQDYHSLFGFAPDERDTPRVDYRFNATIGAEIDSLQPLPPPFAAAYELCKNIGVSQKWYLNSVKMGRSDLATDVFSGGLSMPAVLVGNAAHAIPDILSPADISWVMIDAMDLCYMIVERYNDDRLFSQISNDFYDIKFRRWQKSLHRWDEKWLSAHGLPYNSTRARETWMKLNRASRPVEREAMSESDFNSLPRRARLAVQQFENRERARWDLIQQRIRERFERKHAFTIPEGVEPTKLVLPYIDSRSLPAGNSERQSTQDHDPSGTESSGSS